MAIVIGTGSFLLFTSLAVNIVALLVPYWVDDKNIFGIGYDTYGLWGACSCKWFYHGLEDIKDSRLDDWFQASQWLYAVAVAIMTFAYMMILIVSFCSKNSFSKAATVAGALMLVAAVLVALSVVVFAIMGRKERGFGLEKTPKFIWGMWVAVAGCGAALISSIVFLVQGRTHREYSY